MQVKIFLQKGGQLLIINFLFVCVHVCTLVSPEENEANLPSPCGI